MDFSPTSTAHRRLAHLARQRFVEGLCAGLPALDKTVHDFLTELMGQTATQRDMQLRRDAWMGHQAHRKTWVEHLGRAWRESLAPPPVTPMMSTPSLRASSTHSFNSSVSPLLLIATNTSPRDSCPAEPCTASVPCKKCAGVPVLVMLAAM